MHLRHIGILIGTFLACILSAPLLAAETPPNYDGKPGATAGQACVNAKDGAVMVWVPAGDFQMGCPVGQGFTEEQPQHKVTLDGFWIYRDVVTVAQYRKFCTATNRKMPEAPTWGWKEDHPVVNVNWADAKAYCTWAGMQLPTEAQWEKAARGAEGRVYPWGNAWDATKCGNGTNSGVKDTPFSAHSVGSFPAGASPYGCLDMVGSVWQWCADWYDADYYAKSPAANPTGPATGTLRVLRGASWNYGSYAGSEYYMRSVCRHVSVPNVKFDLYGFRCVTLKN